MNLLVIDFDAHGIPSKVLRRMLGSRAFDWTGIAGVPWLVLAPPGDGGDRSWCRGSQVLEPVRLFDGEALQVLTRDVIEVSNGVEAALDAEEALLHPGGINRDFVRMWVFDLLYRERAILAACRATGATGATILSGHGRRARWLAVGTTALGLPSRGHGLPDGLWRRRSRLGQTDSWTIPNLPRAEVLLVADSIPIAQSFAALAEALPESIRAVALGISYVATTAKIRPSPVRQIHPLRVTSRGIAPPPGRAPRNDNEVALPPGIPGSIRSSFEALRERLVLLGTPGQRDWVRHVDSVLDQVRPRILVVGNDRCWTGQAYTRLARANGIETVVLQDGIAAENDPTWSYSTADHVLAAGTLWPRLLRREPVSWRSLSVVGQPRYDGASQRFSASRGGSPRSRDPGTRRVLLVLQDIHGIEYLRAVLQEILRVRGTEVLIRAHPAYRPTGLEALEDARVRLSGGGDVIDDLAWADLVVTEYSTVAVEALAVGLPVLSVTLSGRPPLLDFTLSGQAECITDVSLIVPAISRLLSAPRGVRESPERRALLDDLVGPLDDSSAERVATIIGRLLRNPAALDEQGGQ